MTKEIDINSDVGESFGNYKIGNDEKIVKYITSINAACGYHAGDPLVIKDTVKLAKKYNLAIGAHPGLPDLMGFGRREMSITEEEAKYYTIYQVGALKAFVEAVDMKLHHFKPHGAFWRITRHNENLTRAILEAVLDADKNIRFIYCPAPTHHFKYQKIAEELNMKVIGEFYVDLQYALDGTLVSKRQMHMIDVKETVNRVIRFIDDGKVKTVEGKDLEFQAESLCVHGDSPAALEVLRTLRIELEKANINITAP